MRRLYLTGGKRLLDIALSIFGIFLFLLPALWIAWRVLRELGAPVLYKQPRVGRNGEIFLLWKFRTISTKGEIPPFCRSLRAIAMDELPQLVNILKGEMSFVGPRPLIPEELVCLTEIPGGIRRLSIRPGLTGLAQLYGPKSPPFQERFIWDLRYIDGASICLDLWILLRSLWVALQAGWEPT